MKRDLAGRRAAPASARGTASRARLKPRPRGGIGRYAASYVVLALLLLVWPQGLFFPLGALAAAGFLWAFGGFLLAVLPGRAWWALTPWLLAGLGYALALAGQPADLGVAQQGALLHLTLVLMAAAGWVMVDDDERRAGHLLAWVGYIAALLALAVVLFQARWLPFLQGLLFTDRWATVFQYPDTAGAVWGAGFLGLVFYRPDTAWERWLARAALVTDGAGLILSLSRGADLVMPLALAAGLALAARRGTWTRILNPLALGGAGALLLSLGWRGHVPATGYGPPVFVAAVAAWVAVWSGLERLCDRLRLSPRQAAGLAAGAGVLLLAALLAVVVERAHRPVVFTAAAPFAIAAPDGAAAGAQVTVRVTAPATLAIYADSRYDNRTLLASRPVSGTARVAVPRLPAGAAAVRFTLTPAHGGSAALLAMRLSGGQSGPYVLDPWFVHVLPRALYTRLLEVNGRQLSIWQRAVFVHDGLRMALARPLLGWGAGGWAAGYRQYQSLPYVSREVHNGWVQWWDDGGILAAAGFAGLLGGLLWAAWRGLRGRLDPDLRWPAAGLAAVSTALLAHSIVDWDFSFFWDELLVAAAWTALMRVTWGEGEEVSALTSYPRVWAVGLASFGLAVLSFLLAGAQQDLNRANLALTRKQPAQVILTDLNRALAADPDLGEAAAMKAQVLGLVLAQSKSPVTAATLGNIAGDFNRAVALNPTNPTLRVAYGNYLTQQRQFAQAVSQYQAAQALAPMKLATVQGALTGDYDVLAQALIAGNREGAVLGAAALRQGVAAYARTRAAIPAGMVANLTLPPLSGAARLGQGVADLLNGRTAAGTVILQGNFGNAQLNAAARAWLAMAGFIAHHQAVKGATGLPGLAYRLVQYGIWKS
ncbi:MAG: O-antigen ligase family protein [Firmicutes bacterium]|nr:O-antigen ligase family protein [Bacillota bacterium]